MNVEKKEKICFVASGGGHLRQLLQIFALHEDYPYYFVTERTSLGESLSGQHKTLFVPHFAFGQRKMEGWLPFLWSGLKNFFSSSWYFAKERPNIVISTGAGAAFFTLFWAYVFRRKIVYIESIARVTSLSLFGKLTSKLAGFCIVQWPDMVRQLKGAKYCSPLLVKEVKDDKKREGLLVTVGTIMPFDRMVMGVEALISEEKISGPVAAQTGKSECQFERLETFESCSFEELNERMRKADIVVCHGGSGSILGALKAGCRVVAMARKQEFKEHYDDHQLDIMNAFSDMGLISIAKDENDLLRAIQEAGNRERKTVEINPNEFISVIEDYIEDSKKPGKEQKMRSLNQLRYIRKALVKAKYLYYTKIWGMDLHESCDFSLSAKFDKTYPKGIHVGAHSYIAFDVAVLSHDMTRGLYLDTHIGKNCFIGGRSVIMPGVKIEDNCIIGAGSVVTKDVSAGSIAAGNPAKVIEQNIEVGQYGRLNYADKNEERLLKKAG